ncbi:hypothetical protein [Clostridium butyricum]|uniref:hypothetical protein n=1 Tax=Clostridium butyricum TaxID=1492 RepID=UPI002ABDE02A|nr:hypothetical protein [Clostridium butyricum]
MFNAEDYEDFRIKYNKYHIKFLLDHLKEFVVTNSIDNLDDNLSLLEPVITKLEEAINSIKEAENLRKDYYNSEFYYYCYDKGIFDILTIIIVFSYEEVITILYYLKNITKNNNNEFILNKLTKELENYIGSHKAWLDFKKISTNT